jgi:hypothetical protein
MKKFIKKIKNYRIIEEVHNNHKAYFYYFEYNSDKYMYIVPNDTIWYIYYNKECEIDYNKLFINEKDLINYLIKKFSTIKEIKNKFKIGDKVIYNNSFISKITSIWFNNVEKVFIYHLDKKDFIYEDEIRKLTKFEEKKYFN